MAIEVGQVRVCCLDNGRYVVLAADEDRVLVRWLDGHPSGFAKGTEHSFTRSTIERDAVGVHTEVLATPPARKPEESRSLTSGVRDMKAGLTGAKPQLSQLPRNALVHCARVLEYGSDKYARGNYHRPAPEGVSDVDRLLGYLDAIARHTTAVTDEITRARGTGGDERAACATPDLDDGDGRFPASALPHLAHLLASATLAIEVAVNSGLLPADPGRPWRTVSAARQETDDGDAIEGRERP